MAAKKNEEAAELEGVPAAHRGELEAMRPDAEAAGLALGDLAALVAEFGPDAVRIGRRIFELIRKRRGGGGSPPAPPAP